jgi:choline-sulfatase
MTVPDAPPPGARSEPEAGPPPGRRAPNVLVILADEHAAGALGCYGHPAVQTPNLDRLATGGVAFDRAYCNSPICVPSRLSLFSGRYVHQIGAWDNGSSPPAGYRTWGHALGPLGYETVLAGRTHFNGPDRLHGFERRLSDDLPHWRHEGQAAPRSPDWRRPTRSHVTECGPGDHAYAAHDRGVADRCVAFLEEKGAAPPAAASRPWLLYCGFMLPHFPLIAPPEFFARYPAGAIPLPETWDEPLAGQHPAIRHLRWAFRNDAPLPAEVQRRATASYWALISYLDHHVGRLLDVIDRSPLREDTVVVYASDHGEMGGQHGIWQKSCFYEASVRVPLIVRAPESLRRGLPPRVADNVSLVDVLPTLIDVAGGQPPGDLPGSSLLDTARRAGETAQRTVFSEYHAQGMLRAGYMVKRGDLKYCHYVGHRAQLFDVGRDPLETRDLIDAPGYGHTVDAMRRELLAIVHPVAADAAALADQAARR